jgi:hypothetical protein
MYKQLALVALALGLIAAPVQAANLGNGNFETGSLSPWTSSGSTNVQQTATYGGSGTNIGLIRNDGASLTATNVEGFLGLSNGALSALGNGNAITGSAIKQTTITVNSGDTFSFAWNFLTDEFQGDSTNDFAFYTINGQAFTLASAASSLVNYFNPAFVSQTGFQTTTLTLAAGTYTFGFGVVNVLDTSTASGLLVDNIAVVPEPDAAMAVACLGIGAFWLRQRRVRS